MTTYPSVLDAIGQTPLIRLNRLTAGTAAAVHVKAEFLNPGGSVKDRAALGMVRAAIADGSLVPGGTIVEGTSGNTGVGLAMVGAHLGYRTVVVVPDKTAAEKIALLRAHGAEVVVTAAGVAREDPAHNRNLARRIAEETPGGWLADQYDNPANPAMHVETTGPEIWRQTEGRITHLVCGIGTGGTISGTGRFLKDVSGGRVRVVGADPATSLYAGGDGSPYAVEAIGHHLHGLTRKDDWPSSYHPDVVDRFERVGDRESIDMLRRAAREEGLLLGGSAGTALVGALRVAAELGPDDLVVVVAPDSGRSYLSKYFDEGWLLRNGFADGQPGEPRVGDRADRTAGLPVVTASATVGSVLAAWPPGAGGPALVVYPRPSEGDDRSPGDVVGTVTRAALQAPDIAPDSVVADHAVGPLVSVGAGEPLSSATERLPADPGPIGVLVDGRVVALLDRSALA